MRFSDMLSEKLAEPEFELKAKGKWTMEVGLLE